ncbi:MAG: hypothetical protein WCG23_10250 [bacterium]
MSDMIDAIGNDLKISIDDLINEIKKNRKDIIKIKMKLGMVEPEELKD